MSCINSFFFISLGDINVPVGTEYDQWGLPPQNYWAYQSNAKESTFNIQGFKNINIHGIDAVGDVTSTVNSTPVLINDWEFLVEINGNNQLIGSNINTVVNDFGIAIQAVNPVISLSRFKSQINFNTPIVSCKSIKIIRLKASGIGVENLSTINLSWKINFVVYYSFEGEDEKFAFL